ncbi:hypothetical protein AMAG_13229 [Allomyces macrogynus ATCC 38327]|uniref:glutathione-specific gamma-glutamylcyclotransferase n=1 Tax=Allomyces macrogynus (strain ATCC 38327) TaxID=578462 RepID=A0A0L0SZY3_ALLM3|nr:hypothetical protein AMAG_13229 [Allomyces macrogynus ATCC 38327]|eukprot:KNE68056.1 hypothetical protein AMAG_13229 [Allomyces macrogynus ATCC 38327]
MAGKPGVWIFGYGSLIWKVDFPVVDRVPGLIRGFVRRFWQGSHDHRGVPGAPGRVVTLIPLDEWKEMKDEHRAPEDCVTWGMAYRLPDEQVDEVLAHLRHREKDGYTEHLVDIFQHQTDKEPIISKAICFIGTTKNSSFHGYKPLTELAQQIATAKGPSGPNDEYLLNLARAMHELAPEAVDHHLYELEERVLSLRRAKESGHANADARSAAASNGSLS